MYTTSSHFKYPNVQINVSFERKEDDKVKYDMRSHSSMEEFEQIRLECFLKVFSERNEK